MCLSDNRTQTMETELYLDIMLLKNNDAFSQGLHPFIIKYRKSYFGGGMESAFSSELYSGHIVNKSTSKEPSDTKSFS